MEYLKKIDMFGAPLTFNLDQNTKYHQTKFGGFATFIVYSLVLVYAIMNLNTWASGGLLPTITTQRSVILDQQHIPLLSQLRVNLSLYPYDPLAPISALDNQFFIVIYGMNNTIAEMQSDGSYSFTLNFRFVDTQAASQFTILSCDPSKITKGKCADNNTVADYLQTYAYYFQLDFNLSYINPNTFEVNVVKQIAYLGLEQGSAHQSTINLGATLFQMQKPAIIQENDYYYGFTTQKQYIETFKEDFGVKTYSGGSIYGSYYSYQYFSLDFVSDVVLIQYPSIFTILGNIGAIGGMLLYFKHVVFFYNTREAEKLMINTIIKKLYPRWREHKFQQIFDVRSSHGQDNIIETDRLKNFESMMKDKIYMYFSLPQMIINQIEFHHFIKEIHPNYQYAGFEFGSVIKSRDEFDLQQEVVDNRVIDLTSFRFIEQEPKRQSVR